MEVTNEQLLQAYNDLLEAYNTMQIPGRQGELNLYKNPHLFWDGLKNLTTADPLYDSLIPVGTTTKALYGNWNNRFMVTVTNASVTLANMPTTLPGNFIKIKIPAPNLESGAFLLYASEADSWTYGVKFCWLCNKETGQPETFLGGNCCDKTSDLGNSYQFSPFNNNALDERYHQWEAFNYTKEQITAALDSDGNVSFALCASVATWYISGWATAERNTSAHVTNCKILIDGFYGFSGNKPVGTGLFNQLYLSHFAANTTYNEVRIPYENSDNGIILGMLKSTDYYSAEPIFSGAVTMLNIQNRLTSNYKSNYARLVIKQLPQFFTCVELTLSSEEVAENSIIVNGLKLLRLKVYVPPNARHAYFCNFYTEAL